MFGSDRYTAAAHAQRALPEPQGALDLEVILRAASLAASSHNTQPWIFERGDGALAIHPDFTRRCPVVDPDDSHLFRSLGCAAENARIAAAAQRYTTSLDFDTAGGTLHLRFRPASAPLPEAALHSQIGARQCTRSAYDPEPVAPEAVQTLIACGSAEGAIHALIEPEKREAIAGLVHHGNLAQIANPAFFGELLAWVRFNPGEALATGDGLSSMATGKPNLPGWLGRRVLRFILTPKSQAAADDRLLATSPLLLAIVTPANARADWVAAGRAYQRAALTATALGLRHAFINQPIEVGSLRPALMGVLGVAGHPSLLLRLGRAAPMPYSLRRPMEAVTRG